MNLLPIDELNRLKADLQDNKLTKEETIDAVLDLLIIAFVYGNQDANESLNTEIDADMDAFMREAYRQYEGKDFVDRVSEYYDDGSVADIMRVAETDSHRLYNSGAFTTAESSGVNALKVWRTMEDERVRDEHRYLEGQKVPMDAKFYAEDGSSAYYPGGFGVPQQDCNCRCFCTYERA